MSKQSDAKRKQNYNPKPVPMVCMNCTHYESDMIEVKACYGITYAEEKNKRCGIGGFAVKKMATCNEWRPK